MNGQFHAQTALCLIPIEQEAMFAPEPVWRLSSVRLHDLHFQFFIDNKLEDTKSR
jgi:hypothetical protein